MLFRSNGNPLAKAHRHDYTVKPAVRERIDPSAWEIVPPRSAMDPLTVRFPRPLDKALAERLIRVVDRAQAPLAGGAEASVGETVWTFRPKAPWAPGQYQLAIDPALEDRIRAGIEHSDRGLFIRMSPQAVEATCRLLATFAVLVTSGPSSWSKKR